MFCRRGVKCLWRWCALKLIWAGKGKILRLNSSFYNFNIKTPNFHVFCPRVFYGVIIRTGQGLFINLHRKRDTQLSICHNKSIPKPKHNYFSQQRLIFSNTCIFFSNTQFSTMHNLQFYIVSFRARKRRKRGQWINELYILVYRQRC